MEMQGILALVVFALILVESEAQDDQSVAQDDQSKDSYDSRFAANFPAMEARSKPTDDEIKEALKREKIVREKMLQVLNTTYPPDFNFHNKTLFLKEQVRNLVECIEATIAVRPGIALPYIDKIRIARTKTGKPFVEFEYNGSRQYNESCLGDAYKNDFIKRLYDGGCINYTEKIQYLDTFSCNALHHLECRIVGEEPVRKYAEQATPIMKCLCPEYEKTQTFITDPKRGYFDTTLNECVLKVGQKCSITAQGLDKRLVWRDIDFENGRGIDVADNRPKPVHYSCVKNAFCYVDESKSLVLDEMNRGRCVCGHKYFVDGNAECVMSMETPEPYAVGLAAVLAAVGTIGAFLAVM